MRLLRVKEARKGHIYNVDTPEIRIVPFAWSDFTGNTFEEIQEDFRNDNYVEYTRNVIAEKNALLLFRTKGVIFASALFEDIEVADDDAYPYRILYKDLVVFDPLINAADLAKIDPGAKTGTRSVRRLDIKRKKEILDLLRVRKIPELA